MLVPSIGQVEASLLLLRLVMMKDEVEMPGPFDPSLTAIALPCRMSEAMETPLSLHLRFDTAHWSRGLSSINACCKEGGADAGVEQVSSIG